MLRIIVIEDQKLVQDSLMSALSRHLDVACVGAFSSMHEVLANGATLRKAEVALVDFHLGAENACDVIPDLRRLAPHLRLIWVTSVDTEFLLDRAIAADLEGFVHKNDPIQVLVTALQRVAGGARFVSPTVEEMRRRFRQRPDHYSKVLSAREQQLLALLGQRLSNEEVAAFLGLSASTVKTHRRNIMDRLDLHSATELQTYALRHGFTTPAKLSGQ